MQRIESTGPTIWGLISPLIPALIALLVGGLISFLADSLVVRLAGLSLAVAPFLLMTMTNVKRSLVILMLMEIPFSIDVYIDRQVDLDLFDAFVGRSDQIIAVLGYNVSITTMSLVILFGLWAVERLAGVSPKLPDKLILAPAVVYLLAVILSFIAAESVTLSSYELTIIIQALLLLIYMVHFTKSRQELILVMTFIAVAVGLQSLLVIAQETTGLSLQLGPLTTRTRGGRVAGTLGSPNTLGSYLGLTVPVCLGLYLTRLDRSYRYLGAAAFGLGVAALIYSFSRGAWIGFTVGLLLVLYLAAREGWVSRRTLATTAVLGAVVLAVFAGSAIVTRATTGSDPQTRSDLMILTLQMIRDNPFLGVGLNNFAAAVDPYYTIDFSQNWLSTVHNKYLLVWAETGLIALFAFIWLLMSALWRALLIVNREDSVLAPMAAGLAAGLTANMIHMTVEIFQGRKQTHLLFIVIGLLLAMWIMPKRESRMYKAKSQF